MTSKSTGQQDQAVAEAPQENTTDMATKDQTTKESKVFNDNKKMLAKLLVYSLTRFSSLAAQEGMIIDGAAVVAAKFGKTTTRNDRAVFLLSAVMKKMDRKINGGAKVMEKFLDSIEDIPLLQEHLSKKYDEKVKENKGEKQLLKSDQARIVSNLELNLLTVADKLLQHGVINGEEHGIIVDPAADYNSLAVREILESIGQLIEVDKANFEKFLSDVLEEIGEPVKTLAEKMRESLKKNPSQALPDSDDDTDYGVDIDIN